MTLHTRVAIVGDITGGDAFKLALEAICHAGGEADRIATAQISEPRTNSSGAPLAPFTRRGRHARDRDNPDQVPAKRLIELHRDPLAAHFATVPRDTENPPVLAGEG